MNVSAASLAPDSSVRKATPSDNTERTARSGAVVETIFLSRPLRAQCNSLVSYRTPLLFPQCTDPCLSLSSSRGNPVKPHSTSFRLTIGTVNCHTTCQQSCLLSMKDSVTRTKSRTLLSDPVCTVYAPMSSRHWSSVQRVLGLPTSRPRGSLREVLWRHDNISNWKTLYRLSWSQSKKSDLSSEHWWKHTSYDLGHESPPAMLVETFAQCDLALRSDIKEDHSPDIIKTCPGSGRPGSLGKDSFPQVTVRLCWLHLGTKNETIIAFLLTSLYTFII